MAAKDYKICPEHLGHISQKKSMTPPSRTDINRVGNVFIELSLDLEPLRIVRIKNVIGTTPFHLFSRILLDRIIQEEDVTSYMLIPHPGKEGFSRLMYLV